MSTATATAFTYKGTGITCDYAHDKYDFTLKDGDKFLVNADRTVSFETHKRVKFKVSELMLSNMMLGAIRVDAPAAKKLDKFETITVKGTLGEFCINFSKAATSKDLFRQTVMNGKVEEVHVFRVHDKFLVGVYNKKTKTGWRYVDVMGATDGKTKPAKMPTIKKPFSIVEARAAAYGGFYVRSVKNSGSNTVGLIYEGKEKVAQFSVDPEGNTREQWFDFASQARFNKVAKKRKQDSADVISAMILDSEIIAVLKRRANKGELIFWLREDLEEHDAYSSSIPEAYRTVQFGASFEYTAERVFAKYGTKLACIANAELQTILN